VFPPRCAVKQLHNFLHLFVELAHPGGLFFCAHKLFNGNAKVVRNFFLRLDILDKAPFFQLVGIEFEKTSSSATAAGFFSPPHRPVDQVSMRGHRVQKAEGRAYLLICFPP